MFQIRRAAERGHFNHGWLDTYHTFSFADYYNPRFMGFRDLRVINEDKVEPGQGFGTHGHRDMEIITYVLEGALAHKDSMGNGSAIRPGDVQRMSAGTGVTHSEFNHSPEEWVHLLQIWILPKKTGQTPSYEQKNFPPESMQDRWRLVASPDGRDGSVTVHQDVDLWAARLSQGTELQMKLKSGRHAWLQVARGAVQSQDEKLSQGDGVAISDEKELSVRGLEDAEVLLFDLN